MAQSAITLASLATALFLYSPLLLLLLAAAALPLLAALALAGARRPLDRLLPLYAATVPFGSGLAVPGLPSSYFSASSLLGLALTLIHLVSIPVTNTSVNPARSLAVAFFVGGPPLIQVWLFIVAPIIGAAIAGISYAKFTGEHPPIDEGIANNP